MDVPPDVPNFCNQAIRGVKTIKKRSKTFGWYTRSFARMMLLTSTIKPYEGSRNLKKGSKTFGWYTRSFARFQNMKYGTNWSFFVQDKAILLSNIVLGFVFLFFRTKWTWHWYKKVKRWIPLFLSTNQWTGTKLIEFWTNKKNSWLYSLKKEQWILLFFVNQSLENEWEESGSFSI